MPKRKARLLAAIAVTMAAVAPAVLASAPAHASSYAYWSYWHNTGSGFKYSGCGPYYPQGDCVPADGTIEGWRFTVSSEGGAVAPRYSGTFDQICNGTSAVAGKKRVAFAVDFGTQPHAPAHLLARCAVGNPNDNGGVLLQSAYSIETGKDGFICKIEQYPKSGCGDYVADPTTTPKPTATARADATPTPVRTTAGSTPSAPTPAPSLSSTRTASTSATPVPFAPSPGAAVTDPLAPSAPGVVFGGESKKASSGSPTGTILGIIAIVAVAGIGGYTARRRRQL